MLTDWLIVLRLCLCLCLCQQVLNGHFSNLRISIRRTQGSFKYYAYAYACVASEDAYFLEPFGKKNCSVPKHLKAKKLAKKLVHLREMKINLDCHCFMQLFRERLSNTENRTRQC